MKLKVTARRILVLTVFLMFTLGTNTFASVNSELSVDNRVNDNWTRHEVKYKIGDSERLIAEGQEKEIELTKEQVEELEKLTAELFEKRKEIIDKYVEFEILSKEKAEKIKDHLDHHFQKMKEANFIPKWDKHKKRKDD